MRFAFVKTSKAGNTVAINLKFAGQIHDVIPNLDVVLCKYQMIVLMAAKLTCWGFLWEKCTTWEAVVNAISGQEVFVERYNNIIPTTEL